MFPVRPRLWFVIPGAAIAATLFALSGCAVLTPEEADVVQVRAIVAERPGVTIDRLSYEVGISETAVIAALPETMRRAVEDAEMAMVGQSLPDWGTARFELKSRRDAIQHQADRWDAMVIRNDRLELTHGGFTAYIDRADIGWAWLIDRPAQGSAAGMRGLILCDTDGNIRYRLMVVNETGPGFSRAWERLEQD